MISRSLVVWYLLLSSSEIPRKVCFLRRMFAYVPKYAFARSTDCGLRILEVWMQRAANTLLQNPYILMVAVVTPVCLLCWCHLQLTSSLIQYYLLRNASPLDTQEAVMSYCCNYLQKGGVQMRRRVVSMKHLVIRTKPKRASTKCKLSPICEEESFAV